MSNSAIIVDNQQQTPDFEKDAIIVENHRDHEMERADRQMRTKDTIQEMQELLNVENRLKLDYSIRIFLLEFIVMLVWFSCAYKCNLLSFVLILVLTYHAYKQR